MMISIYDLTMLHNGIMAETGNFPHGEEMNEHVGPADVPPDVERLISDFESALRSLIEASSQAEHRNAAGQLDQLFTALKLWHLQRIYGQTGRVDKTAVALGISRVSLHNRIKKLGLTTKLLGQLHFIELLDQTAHHRKEVDC